MPQRRGDLHLPELPVSRRFGPQIASVASCPAIRRPQQVHGADPNGQVAALLFDDATASDVVPTFERMAAAIVLEDILLKRTPRVLGARQSRGTPYPQSISCHIPDNAPPSRPSPTAP